MAIMRHDSDGRPPPRPPPPGPRNPGQAAPEAQARRRSGFTSTESESASELPAPGQQSGFKPEKVWPRLPGRRAAANMTLTRCLWSELPATRSPRQVEIYQA